MAYDFNNHERLVWLDTDVWWDEQKTVRDSQNRIQLICHNGHDWFTQLHEDTQ